MGLSFVVSDALNSNIGKQASHDDMWTTREKLSSIQKFIVFVGLQGTAGGTFLSLV